MLPIILSSPLPPSSASFPLLQYLVLLSSLLFHPLNSSSLLPSTFSLPLPPFSPGSGTFPSLHWLPLYLQGTNRTAWTGEGTHMNKHLVRNNTTNNTRKITIQLTGVGLAHACPNDCNKICHTGIFHEITRS